MEEEEGKKCLLVELIDASAFFEGDLLGGFSVNWFLFFFFAVRRIILGGGGRKLTLNIGIFLAFVTVSARFLMVGVFGGLGIDGWMVDGLRGLKG